MKLSVGNGYYMIQGNRFNLVSVFESSILTILKATKVSKAAGLGSLSGRFLKDGAKFSSKHIGDMSQAAKCDLFLYTDDSCLACQHKDINEIPKHLKIRIFLIYVIGLWIIS